MIYTVLYSAVPLFAVLIMLDSDRLWAIAYYLYYPLAAIIAICAIWMFIEKRKIKKEV